MSRNIGTPPAEAMQPSFFDLIGEDEQEVTVEPETIKLLDEDDVLYQAQKVVAESEGKERICNCDCPRCDIGAHCSGCSWWD